jgi:hypothetical protein
VSPLAEVEGECITNEAVENALGATLRRLERQIYETKRQKLGLINERLLAREAAKRGVTVYALLEAEVTAKGDRHRRGGSIQRGPNRSDTR